MTTQRTRIGPFSVGEKLEPLQVTIKDAAGAVVDISGYTVKMVIHDDSDGAVVAAMGGSGTLPGAGSDGVAQYDWSETDMLTAGRFYGQIWVGNGTYRLASEVYEWDTVQNTNAPAI